MTATLATERLCVCTHAAVVHQLNPAKVRTWCTHMDGSGQCRCGRFLPAELPLTDLTSGAALPEASRVE